MILFARLYIIFWTLNALRTFKTDLQRRNQAADELVDEMFESLEDLRQTLNKKNVSMYLHLVLFAMFAFVTIGYVLVWYCSDLIEWEKNFFIFVVVMDLANFFFGIRVIVKMLHDMIVNEMNRNEIILSMVDLSFRVPPGITSVIMLGRASIGIAFIIKSFF